MPENKLREKARHYLMERFHEILPNRNLEAMPKDVVNYAIDDLFETSAIAESGHFGIGDVQFSVERTLLHFLGHPDFN